MTNASRDLPLELPDATTVGEGELRKSGETRRRILEAGLNLLAEEGYRGFTAVAVAERTGLARAAMLYHFPTRAALLAAVVHHVVRLRIDRFTAALDALPAQEGTRGEAPPVGVVRLNWEMLHTPEFAAFGELVVAARTDPELAAIIRPALAVLDRARRITAERLFPVSARDTAHFQLVRDVVRYLSEGLAMQDSIVENRETRMAALRHFLHMLAATDPGSDFLRLVVADWQVNQDQWLEAVRDPPPAATGG